MSDFKFTTFFIGLLVLFWGVPALAILFWQGTPGFLAYLVGFATACFSVRAMTSIMLRLDGYGWDRNANDE